MTTKSILYHSCLLQNTPKPYNKQYFLLLSLFLIVFLCVNPFTKYLFDSPLSLSFHLCWWYLEDDSSADYSCGDILLFVSHSLDLTELSVQQSMYVGEHRPHRAAGYVEDILTADDQESEQHEAEEELGHQGPHCPALIPSKSTQAVYVHTTMHSPRLQCLLFPTRHFSQLREKVTAAASSLLSLDQSHFGFVVFSSYPSSVSWGSGPFPQVSIPSPSHCRIRSTQAMTYNPGKSNLGRLVFPPLCPSDHVICEL